MQKNQTGFLNANVLKIIALVTMTIDHLGMVFFPTSLLPRLIGRIAFPLYAFFIAEGCKHTKNKQKYLINILLLGLICQFINIFIGHRYYLNILITFSFSIILIYLINSVKQSLKQKNRSGAIISIIAFVCASALICVFTIYVSVDYGFFGVLVPVLVYLFDNKYLKTAMFTIGLILISLNNIVQLFCLFAVPLVWFYNGTKGKLNIKYLFYIYYPVHLVVIYGISLLINL